MNKRKLFSLQLSKEERLMLETLSNNPKDRYNLSSVLRRLLAEEFDRYKNNNDKIIHHDN
jgi:hypothetical protein